MFAKIILLLTIFSNHNKFCMANDTDKTTPTITWTSFIKTLPHCTIQVFYARRDYKNLHIISDLQNLNVNLNFVIDEVDATNNRYVMAEASRHDEFGIIPNFPFKGDNFNLIFSNCHVALIFSPPVNPLTRMWGMAAFNEDPDYIVILDRAPGSLDSYLNYYFSHTFSYRVTSILLYGNMLSNVLSLMCNICVTFQTRR